MKKLIALTIFLTFLTTSAFSFAVRTDSVSTPKPSFLTGIYTANNTACPMVGAAIPIHRGLYSISYGDAGRGGTVGTEVALFYKPSSSKPIYIAAILGGQGKSYGTEDNYLTYLLGSTGGILLIGEGRGLWLAAKYNFKFEDNAYVNDWTYGIGVFFNIGN
jgi:hypothetical protein